MSPYSLGLRPAPLVGGMPAFVQSALSQATAVLAKYGGRMYYNPTGFDPYAFLNSDGSGGLSNAPGQLVGAALDLVGGVGSGAEINTQPFPSVANGWTAIGGAAFPLVASGQGFIVTAGASNGGVFKDFPVTPGVPLAINAVAFSILAGSAGTFILYDGAGFGPVLFQTATTGSNISAVVTPTLSAVRLYYFANVNTSILFQPASIKPFVQNLAGAATQATNANKPILAAGPTPWFQALSISSGQVLSSALAATHITNADTDRFFVLGLTSGFTAATNRSMYVGKRGGAATRVDTVYMNPDFTLAYLSRNDAGVQFAVSVQTLGPNQAFTVDGVAFGGNMTLRCNGATPITTALPSGAAVGVTDIGDSPTLPSTEQRSVLFVAQGPGVPTAAEMAILRRFAGICAGTVTS